VISDISSEKVNCAKLIYRIKAAFAQLKLVFNPVRITAFVGIFIACESFFVSLFGGTIGHLANGMCVKRSKSMNENIILP